MKRETFPLGLLFSEHRMCGKGMSWQLTSDNRSKKKGFRLPTSQSDDVSFSILSLAITYKHPMGRPICAGFPPRCRQNR